MPYCTACGAEVGVADAYCTSCGERLTHGAGGGDGGGDRPAADADRGPGRARRADPDPTTAGAEDGGGPAERAAAGATERAATGAAAAGEPSDAESTASAATIRGRRLAGAGVALAGIGAFLPWVELQTLGSTVAKDGVEGDGAFTLAFAVLAGVVLLLGKRSAWTRKARGSVFVLGVLTALIGSYYLVDPLAGVDASSQTRDAIRRGTGLYLTAIGGVLLALGPAYATIRRGE